MFDDVKGPIEHFSWGKFVIDGKEHSKPDDSPKAGVGKDIRLIGREVTAWKERKGHDLNPNMITGVYDQGIEVLIIGKGVHGLVTVSDAVKTAIREHGISELIVEKTPDACKTYNQLYQQGRKVALLAHGTC